ncbi:MAG: SdrD B-like domain-containing protein, partial [Saprospiraceae bacterium]
MINTVSDNNNGGANATNGLPGFWGARGISYSEFTDRIYVAARENCVSVFSNDLTPLPAFNIGNPLNGRPKGIDLLKECCPTNNNVVLDTTLCAASTGDILFLQQLINCEGAICEGLWEEGAGNTGLAYNDCNNSVEVTAPGACGTFTFESDGTGRFARCGIFKFEVNIEVENITAPVIAAGDAPTCANGNDPGAFTFSTPASGSSAITYKWQESATDCDGPWSDVAGAPTDATPFDPPALTEDTYYRVITSVNDGCLTGICADTSNCVMVAVEDGNFSIDLVTVSGCYLDPATGQSIAAVNVEISWTGTPPGSPPFTSSVAGPRQDSIAVMLNGETKFVYAESPYVNREQNIEGYYELSSPQLIRFYAPADGQINQEITANFTSDPNCVITAVYDRPVACPQQPCVIGPGTVGGSAFEDFNGNGVQNAGEPTGVPDITVNIYGCDAAGNSVLAGTTVTNTEGDYFFDASNTTPALVDGESYRIEFIQPTGTVFEATCGWQSGYTTVQFATSPSCEVSLGLVDPSTSCQENPDIV